MLLWFVYFFTALLATAAVESKPPPPAQVLIQEAKPIAFSDIYIWPGRVRSKVSAKATSDMEGQVVHLEKPLGSKVKKGDLILILQNLDPVYRYAPNRVRSQADGYLTSLDVSLFTKVNRGDLLFTVTDPNDLLIATEVPAESLSMLKIGQSGQFKIQSENTVNVPVVIEGLSPIVDIKTGTALAEFKPLQNVESLRQGQLGSITIETNKRDTFLFPESAILYRDEKPFVRYLVKGKVQKRAVELGARRGDNIEVRSGIQNGEQIVINANRFMVDGEVVEVQKPSEKL